MKGWLAARLAAGEAFFVPSFAPRRGAKRGDTRGATGPSRRALAFRLAGARACTLFFGV